MGEVACRAWRHPGAQMGVAESDVPTSGRLSGASGQAAGVPLSAASLLARPVIHRWSDSGGPAYEDRTRVTGDDHEL